MDFYENELKKIDAEIQFFKLAKTKFVDYKQTCEVIIAETIEQKIASLLEYAAVIPILKKVKLLDSNEAVIQICDYFCDVLSMQLQQEELIEKCVRTVAAFLSQGVVSAPFEGISKIAIEKNEDNSKYVAIYYAGPIRGLGGSTSIITVLTAEYLAKKFGLGVYIPTEDEVQRYVIEIARYKRIHSGIYNPPGVLIREVVKRCPVCVTGVATEEEEVDNYKFLPRVSTPRIRGGASLIITEGICLKAKKIVVLAKMFGADWSWLLELKEKYETNLPTQDKVQIPMYLQSLAVGRPIFSLHNQKHGFRIRIGRSRNTGLGTVGIHPLCFKLLRVLNTGTQLITHEPGKGAATVPVSELEPPKVLLKNGSHVSMNEDIAIKDVKQITDLGEILIPYGDYAYNNVKLPHLDFCVEYWQKITGKNYADLQTCIREHLPIYPFFHPFTDNIDTESYLLVKRSLQSNAPVSLEISNVLIDAGFQYTLENGRYIFKEPLLVRHFFKLGQIFSGTDFLEYVNLKNKQYFNRGKGTIGARMGRVEASSKGTMDTPINSVCDVKEGRFKTNIVQKIMEIGTTFFKKLPCRLCDKCQQTMYQIICNTCGKYTHLLKIENNVSRILPESDILESPTYRSFEVDLKSDYTHAKKRLRENLEHYPIKIGNNTFTSIKSFEIPEKAILRAKHGVLVYKDGTARINASNITLTHFKPCEANVDYTRLIELGYTHDINNKPLVSNFQILTLKLQDVLLPLGQSEYLLKISKFVDELLVYNNSEPYYSAKTPSDLVGTYVAALAPHTYAATIGRVVGFSNCNCMYANYLYHAARRRNCDGDEDAVMLLGDLLLNFSRGFLKDGNGAKMNVPLIVSRYLVISNTNLDQEALFVEVTNKYPVEIYEKSSAPIVIDRIDNYLHLSLTELQKKIVYSVETDKITQNTLYNAYKDLETMQEKLDLQLRLAELLRGIDANEIAIKVLTTQLLPDITGCTRTFFKQKFRCATCKKDYVTMPLVGRCRECRCELLMTIHPKSVGKYRHLIIKLKDAYPLTPYMQSSINKALHQYSILEPAPVVESPLKKYLI